MRRKNVIKNVKISLIFFIVSIMVNFISRSFFIKVLGSNISGFNNLILNLLGFLNVAELGVASAITYSLYKPLIDNDKEKINEIMILFKHYYKNIGKFVLLIGIILSLSLKFFVKDQLPLSQAFTYYYLFLINNVINYFLNYKQTLIIADQKQYIVTVVSNTSKIIKTIIQICLLLKYKSYFIWIIVELLFNLTNILIINQNVKLRYKDITYKSEKSIEKIQRENKSITKTIKDVFFHKIATFIVYQADSIMISLFLTLKDTAIYGNYMMIINNLLSLFSTVMGSFKASIGNLVAEKNDEKSWNIFKQLYLLDNFIALIITYSLYRVVNSFIILWVGEEYLFSSSILFVLIVNLYIQIARASIDKFKDAYGIFWDRWAPIIEGAINIVISIGLVNKIGVIGLFIGTFFSNITVVLLWKPYVLFKYGFKKSIIIYYLDTLKIILTAVVSIFLSNRILEYISNIVIFKEITFILFIINSSIIFGVITIISLSLFILIKDFRMFLLSIVNKKNKNKYS